MSRGVVLCVICVQRGGKGPNGLLFPRELLDIELLDVLGDVGPA